ncbi:hypothetical protein GCM10025875_08620 [Litorihabitans aurantiacus]|uniref:Uncharacterized protein n=1 Tax=Litorihabitans aurantiacus TaxID=1930061 RepID=A0AA37XD88_9MICO|nr:hypothetical protein GCM10025875_08620 [Litorihabitans aurantiacus]
MSGTPVVITLDLSHPEPVRMVDEVKVTGFGHRSGRTVEGWLPTLMLPPSPPSPP